MMATLRFGRGGLLRAALAALAVALAITPEGEAVAQETVELRATYFISVSGLTVGRAEVRGRFAEGQYATAISGSTLGISRFVTDARAELSGNGRIRGSKILPNSYKLDTREGDLVTLVRMAMNGGAVTRVDARPSLVEAPDRVPIRQSDKRDVVDPIGAFVVSLDRERHFDGNAVCNRTVRVFDGWQRFDVRLFYRHDKQLKGAYDGRAIVCGARYVPVAGHRPGRPVVEYMSQNKRLEVWMIPVAGTDVMVPFQLLIGTSVGDLMITAREFSVSDPGRQAGVR